MRLMFFMKVQSAVVRAMTSHADLAEHVMRHDQQAMGPLVALVYEMLKSGANIDTSMTDMRGEHASGRGACHP
jgi:hypothetical protein